MDNQFFRGVAVGGFHRKDVLNYVEATARAHAHTVDTLKSELAGHIERANAAEAAREAARAELETLRAEFETYKSDCAQQRDTYNQGCRELETLRAETDALRETLLQRELELDRAIEAAVAFEGEYTRAADRLVLCEATEARFESSKKRVADIELEAYRRAEAIEAEALAAAAAARDTLRRLMTEARHKYESVRGDAESTAAHLAGELDRLRADLSVLVGTYAGISASLEAANFLDIKGQPSHPPEPLPLDPAATPVTPPEPLPLEE